MFNVQALTQTLSAMPLPRLQAYLRQHQDDPYTIALGLSIAKQKQQAATAQQGMAGRQPMPKVVDQELDQLASADPMGNYVGTPLPENVGIGRLPAKNLAKMAGGGIVAFDEGGEVPRYNGSASSFVGPVMSFQQFLTQKGVPITDFVYMTPQEQQTLTDAYKSTGMGVPSGAAPTASTPTSAAASPPSPEAPRRGYGLGRTAGSFARGSVPYIAGTEVLGNLGSYKLQEPGLDTSVSGVAEAFGKGDLKQAGKNLLYGIPEAGLDVLRAGAGLGDYALPGQPLTSGLDTLVKKAFPNMRTPADLAQATDASKKQTEEKPAAGSTETPPGPGPSPTPVKTETDRLAELTQQFKALTGGAQSGAPSTAGLPGLQAMSAEDAKKAAGKLVDAEPVLSQFRQYREQVNADIQRNEQTFLEEQALLPKFGAKAEETLKKREQELADDRKAAGWMALLETGLSMMAGTSPYALVNIGAGGQKGLASYKDAMKDIKKLQSEYDKLRLDIEQANVAEARGDFKARNDFRQKENERRDAVNQLGIKLTGDIFQTNSKVAGDIWNNSIRENGETARTLYREQGATARTAQENQSRVALGLMGLAKPGETEKLYTTLGGGDPVKGLNIYANALGYGDKNSVAVLKEYTGPLGAQKLKELENGTPEQRLYAMQIRQRIKDLQGIGAVTPVNVQNALP